MFRKNSAKKVLKIIISKRLFLVSVIFGLFLCFDFASAQSYTSLVQIPGMAANPNALKYLSGLYTFLISVVGIVAMGAIVIGGARYLTSVGNPSAIADAKNTINSAIIGLLLALASWVIIGEINPDILVLKQPDMSLVSGVYDFGENPPRCALPTGAGTVEAPCTCLDSENREDTVAGNFGTGSSSLTMTVTPATVAVGGTFTVSGTLTDSLTGGGIGGVQLALLQVNPSFNASGLDINIVTTTADGNFSFTRGPIACSATEQWQVIFYGNVNYAPSGSNIILVAGTGNPVCSILAYPDSPAKPFFDGDDICQQICSNEILAVDGQYHCGWDFLVVRANIDGETLETSSSGDTYYILDTDKSQLWDMFLTNEGGWGAFKVTATSYDDSKGYHYECAILVTARRVTNLLGFAVTGDYRNIFWVLPNTIIHKDGFSLEKDLCNKYAQCCNQPGLLIPPKPPCDLSGSPGCDWSHDSTCALSTFLSGTHDIPLRYKGASRLFGAKYLSGIVNERCGDENPGTKEERSCLQALSRTEYRPGGDLLCSPVNGKWVPY